MEDMNGDRQANADDTKSATAIPQFFFWNSLGSMSGMVLGQ